MTNRRYNAWATILEANGCSQFARGLREQEGLGRQRDSSGGLNGFHLENSFVKAIEELVGYNLAGQPDELVRKTVDRVCRNHKLGVSRRERDKLALLLINGKL